MVICKKFKDYLDKNGVQYITIKHPIAYTAQKTAASLHVSGDMIAKTVMINVDGEMIMCVCPASYKIDLSKLKVALDASEAELVSEREFSDKFPDCEPGAMPPFGNIYGIPVYVAQSLTKDEEIIFNAGSHNEVIQMNYSDYENLVNPSVLPISVHRH